MILDLLTALSAAIMVGVMGVVALALAGGVALLVCVAALWRDDTKQAQFRAGEEGE